jgi:hypothetical protein
MRTYWRHNLVSKVIWCLSKKEWRRLSIAGLKVEINTFQNCQEFHPSFSSLSVSCVQRRTFICFEFLPVYEYVYQFGELLWLLESCWFFGTAADSGLVLLSVLLSKQYGTVVGGSDYSNAGSISPTVPAWRYILSRNVPFCIVEIF